MSDSFDFRCPNCDQLHRAALDSQGSASNCKKCGARFLVPSSSGDGEAIPRAIPWKDEWTEAPSPNPDKQQVTPKPANDSSVSKASCITVQCLSCGKSLKWPTAAAGRTGKCSGCGAEIHIPGPTSSPDPDRQLVTPKPACTPAPKAVPIVLKETPSHERQCPFCMETILLAAIKCKYCDSSIPMSGAGKKDTEILGTNMLVAPLAGTGLLYFWVGNMRLMDGPAKWLFPIVLLVILSTATLAYLEGRAIGMGTGDPDKMGFLDRQTPTEWFTTITSLWIIGLPLYLYARSRRGLRNLVLPGIVVALLFAFSLWHMHGVIEAAMEDIRAGLRQ